MKIEFNDILSTLLDYKIKSIDTDKRKNLSEFIICNKIFPMNSKILLIDDFLETGTTIIESINAIMKKNPKCSIIPVVFFRESNTKSALR